MGLMDIARAAIGPAAAARGGYLEGQQKRADDDEARARQSRLDQMKAQMDSATIARDAASSRRDDAEAGYYTRRPTDPKVPEPAPHTVNAAEGIMQWDPAQRKFVKTGLHTPPPAGDRQEGRRAEKESRLETQGALSGVERQIGDTRTELKDVPNDLSITDDNAMNTRMGTLRQRLDSLTHVSDTDDNAMNTRMGTLRQRLDSLTHVSDSLNGVLKGGPPPARNGETPAPVAAPRAPRAPAPDAAAGAYADAASAYKEAVSEATTAAERTQARELYDRAVQNIARRHGQVR